MIFFFSCFMLKKAFVSVRIHWENLQLQRFLWWITASTSELHTDNPSSGGSDASNHLWTSPADIYSTSVVWRPASASNISSSAAPWSSMLGKSGWSSSTLSSSRGSTTSQSSRICQTFGRGSPKKIQNQPFFKIFVWFWSFWLLESFYSSSKRTMMWRKKSLRGNASFSYRNIWILLFFLDFLRQFWSFFFSSPSSEARSSSSSTSAWKTCLVTGSTCWPTSVAFSPTNPAEGKTTTRSSTNCEKLSCEKGTQRDKGQYKQETDECNSYCFWFHWTGFFFLINWWNFLPAVPLFVQNK